jgi:hypothetical protein
LCRKTTQNLHKNSHLFSIVEMLGTDSVTKTAAGPDASLKDIVIGRVSQFFARDGTAPCSLGVALAENGTASNFLINHVVDNTEASLAEKALGVIYENQIAQTKFDSEMLITNKKINDLNSELEAISDMESEAWAQIKAKKDELQETKCAKERMWTACVDEFHARYQKIDDVVGAKLNEAEDKIRKAGSKGSKI